MNANFEGLFEDKADAVVIILGAKRNDGEHITDAQKDAAMNAAKSVLQIVGADVVATVGTKLVLYRCSERELKHPIELP